MAAIRLILFVLCVCVAGCVDAGQPTTSPPIAASETDLDAMIAKQGSATFRSFEGTWIGMDGDTDLTFLPHGAVHMFEYGIGVSGYHGTYAINSRGKITLELPTFGHAWPAMSLLQDAKSLLLVPVPDEGGVVMGNRGGVTVAPNQGTYWPFRPLSPIEDAQVRESIRNRGGPAVH